MATPTIVITGYQRSDFIADRVAEILFWRQDCKIIIAIDGLRRDANSKEAFRRDSVLSKAHDLRCRFENVNIYEWKQNLGLNQHASRLFSRLAKEFSEVIIVEDDVSLAPDGFEFLYTNCGSHQAVAASAYLSHSHSGLDSKLYRETFFPQQWGVALRFEILEEYCRLIKDKKLNKRLLREHFHSSLREHFSYVKIELLVYWWYNHFYFCLEHVSWPDALIQ